MLLVWKHLLPFVSKYLLVAVLVVWVFGHFPAFYFCKDREGSFLARLLDRLCTEDAIQDGGLHVAGSDYHGRCLGLQRI